MAPPAPAPPVRTDVGTMAYALARVRNEFSDGLQASNIDMNLVKDAYPESDEETLSSESDASDGDEPAPPTENSSATAIPVHLAEQYSAKRKRAPVDDPELHEGRHRKDRGKKHGYSTHVQLEWTPNRSEYHALDEVIMAVRYSLRGSDVVVKPRYLSDTQIQLPLHISLSHGALLDRDQRWDYMSMIRKEVAQKSKVKPFSIKLGAAYWWTCFESEEHWLCLAVVRPDGDELNKLYAATDHVSRAFDLPRLYPSGVESTDESSSATAAIGTLSDATDRPQHNSDHQSHGSGLGDKTDNFHITIATTNRKLSRRELHRLPKRAAYPIITAVQDKGILFKSITCKVGTITEKIKLLTKIRRNACGPTGNTSSPDKKDACGPTGNTSSPDNKKQNIESQ